MQKVCYTWTDGWVRQRKARHRLLKEHLMVSLTKQAQNDRDWEPFLPPLPVYYTLIDKKSSVRLETDSRSQTLMNTWLCAVCATCRRSAKQKTASGFAAFLKTVILPCETVVGHGYIFSPTSLPCPVELWLVLESFIMRPHWFQEPCLYLLPKVSWPTFPSYKWDLQF